MRKSLAVLGLAAVLGWTFSPSAAHAFGVDVSVQGEQITPDGNLGYKAQNLPSNHLDLQNDLGYSKINTFTARVKVEWPVPLIPNIYLQATPMKFDGNGIRSQSFTYGDQTFQQGVPYTSTLQLDHYDLGIFYGIPFLKTATDGILNVDWGLNVRLIDFKANVTQPNTGLSQSESRAVPVPMGYVGLQVKPIDLITVNAELRGIGYGDSRYVDLVAGARVKVFMMLYVGGGYKYQNLKINYQDIDSDLRFGGPFVEIGASF